MWCYSGAMDSWLAWWGWAHRHINYVQSPPLPHWGWSLTMIGALDYNVATNMLWSSRAPKTRLLNMYQLRSNLALRLCAQYIQPCHKVVSTLQLGCVVVTRLSCHCKTMIFNELWSKQEWQCIQEVVILVFVIQLSSQYVHKVVTRLSQHCHKVVTTFLVYWYEPETV